MDTEAQEFFRAGLREYGHAWRAVADFKAELVRTLQDALQRKEQRSPGSVLVLADEPKFVTSAGALETPAKPYISVFATIKDPRAASDGQKLGEEGLTGKLELGVWWWPLFDPSSELGVYSGVSGMPWSKQLKAPAGFPGKAYKSYASTQLTMPFRALEQELPPVLDELLVHVDSAAREQLTAARG